MFRDRKKGGYDLEGTSLKGNRLINMILLMKLAYSSAIFQGTEMKKKQVQEYVSRRKEPKKKYRRRSTFGVGIDGEKWVHYLERMYCLIRDYWDGSNKDLPFAHPPPS
jgi:hypothetical protein